MAKNVDELRAALRARDLRATPSRLAVLELLRAKGAPMSHGERLYHALESSDHGRRGDVNQGERRHRHGSSNVTGGPREIRCGPAIAR